MVIERITKEKLDKIRNLIGDLNESCRKNYGPGRFFTNETIINGDKFDDLVDKVNHLMENAEEMQKTIDMYIRFIAEKLPNETITFYPDKKKLYIPEKKEEKKPINTPTKRKAPKPTKQVSKSDVANDNGIDMLLL